MVHTLGVLQIVHKQLEYLKLREELLAVAQQNGNKKGSSRRETSQSSASSSSNYNKAPEPIVTSSPPSSPQRDVDLMKIIRHLEAKLLEKDKYYVSVIDEINTRLYYIEGTTST